MTIADKIREKVSTDEGLADFLLNEDCDNDMGCNPTDCPFYDNDPDNECGCLSERDELKANCRAVLIKHLKHNLV